MKKIFREQGFHPARQKILLRNRKDREGTNWINKVANFIRAKFSNSNVYHYKIKYPDSIWSKTFENFSKQITAEEIKQIAGVEIPEKNMNGEKSCHFLSAESCWDCASFLCSADTTKEIELDLVSAFEKYFKKDFLHYLNKDASREKSLWQKGEKIICIHLRLEDVRKKRFKHEAIISDCKNIEQYIETPDKTFSGKRPISQVPSKPEYIKKLIANLESSYPLHKICIITAPQSKNLAKEQFPEYRVEVPDKDGAIWSMINADVLVLSRSKFSAMAGFLHQGSRVFYPPWGDYSAMGLGGKFDKTKNWTIARTGQAETDFI